MLVSQGLLFAEGRTISYEYYEYYEYKVLGLALKSRLSRGRGGVSWTAALYIGWTGGHVARIF